MKKLLPTIRFSHTVIEYVTKKLAYTVAGLQASGRGDFEKNVHLYVLHQFSSKIILKSSKKIVITASEFFKIMDEAWAETKDYAEKTSPLDYESTKQITIYFFANKISYNLFGCTYAKKTGDPVQGE